METQKIEELRKKMFKAPNKDEINEIVEKDLMEEYTLVYPAVEYKALSKAKNEKEFRIRSKGIKNININRGHRCTTFK